MVGLGSAMLGIYEEVLEVPTCGLVWIEGAQENRR